MKAARSIAVIAAALVIWEVVCRVAHVRENVAFGLEIRGDRAAREKADALLDKLALGVIGDRYPKDLSGGMRQRVALARALALDAPMLRMDEPFGALDALTRRSMQDEPLSIWTELKQTIVFVTHGIEESLLLADRVVVMTYRPGTVKEIVPVRHGQAARRGVARVLGRPPGDHADGPRGAALARTRRADLSPLHLKTFVGSCYRPSSLLQAVSSVAACSEKPIWSFGTSSVAGATSRGGRMSSATEAMPVGAADIHIDAAAERRVIIASSVGTVFEWYDFYLYAILAPFFAALFFPPGNQTAALLGAFGAYAAGFLVRPFGALIFGRIGDLVGRKYTFLVTIVTMGTATVLVGFLPTYATIGFAAPLILVALRLAQGLALGGEYGGAATYVAEHSADTKRGYTTAWIQTTATVGMLFALVVIGLTRSGMSAATFNNWGWRISFWVSIPLLAISVYIRLKLQESPVFQRMKTAGKRSKSPIRDSFFKYPNNKFVALALFGATAGQGVVWYTGQFYALFFLLIYLKLEFVKTYWLVGLSLVIGTPFFLVFGALSDKIGRLKIILAGCLIAAVTYIPLFKGLTHFVNPALEAYQARTTIDVYATECNFHIFIGPWSKQTACDRAKDFLGKAGLSFNSHPAMAGESVVTKIGNLELRGWDEAKYKAALTATNYPAKADTSQVNWVMAEILLVIMVIYVTMVYGPIAAFLVELFPTNIRYTSMSLPYHIGNGWFGGMLPLLATSIVAKEGNIYAGLWYPIIVSLLTLVIGALFIREPKHVKIRDQTF